MIDSAFSDSAVTDPFALLMNPERVLHAIECSDRLKRLHSRVCRPLDVALARRNAAAHTAAEDFDALVDSQPDDEDSFA